MHRAYIISMVILVSLGTIIHIIRPYQSDQNILNLKSFSIFNNVHKIFAVENGTRPDGLLSWIKMSIVVFGVCAHVMSCLESAIGFIILSHHKNLEKLISNPAMAPIFGDAGITIITAVAGY